MKQPCNSYTANAAPWSIAFAAILTCGLVGCGGGGTTSTDSTPTFPTVDRVVIGGAYVAVAPGSSKTLTAIAYDAQGKAVQIPLTWQSTNTSIAIVHGSQLTGMAVGEGAVSVSAPGGVTTTVPVYVNAAGNSLQLIAAAAKKGTLSMDDALVLAVQAQFGDSGVPGAYRSTIETNPRQESRLLNEAGLRFDSLTPTQQNALVKYLVPPAYRDGAGALALALSKSKSKSNSALAGPHERASVSSNLGRPGACSGSTDAGWNFTATDNFRIWSKTGSKVTLRHIDEAAAAAEKAYKKIVVELKFKAPVKDDGGLCSGGDEKYDIYFDDTQEELLGTTHRTGFYTPWSDSSAAYTVIGFKGYDQVMATVTHEFMHAVLYAYKNWEGSSYEWAHEALANWAIDQVEPGNNYEWNDAGAFLSAITKPLFFPNAYCHSLSAALSDLCDGDGETDMKMYGSYLLFQYIAKLGTPSVIRVFCEAAAARKDSLAALDYALTDLGGLTVVWNKFAVALWNDTPLDTATTFQGIDPGEKWEKFESASLSHLNGTLNDLLPEFHDDSIFFINREVVSEVQPSPVDVPIMSELSASIQRYRFTDPRVRSFTYFNGYTQLMNDSTFSLQVNVQGTPVRRDLGLTPIVYQATAEERFGRQVWAMYRIGNVWQSQDWSDQRIRTFCRDNADERIEELVLIYSNGNFSSTRSSDFAKNGATPIGTQQSRTLTSQLPCWKVQGRTSNVLEYADGKDDFTITTALTGTFIGTPNFSAGLVPISGTSDMRDALRWYGYTFIPDRAAIYTQSMRANLPSCNPIFPVFEASSQGAASSLNPMYFYVESGLLPGSLGSGSYVSQNLAVSYRVGPCGLGNDRHFLPGVAYFDFNLDLRFLQTYDLASERFASLPEGMPAPPATTGDFPRVGNTVSRWCLAAQRAGEQPPVSCP